MRRWFFLIALILVSIGNLFAQNGAYSEIDRMADQLEPQVIAWRRDFHQYPELSNREFKTAEKVAAHLRSLGLEVRTGVAATGVVGILRTGKPGPTIALRADMDALPVTERAPVPFASRVRDTYLDTDVGVMHACGHDTHMAMLMGAATVLTKMKGQLKGTVVFLFQPAEEGAPPGEKGGAGLMVEEGVLDNPKAEVVFGLHINAQTEVGMIRFKPGGTMAAADKFTIKVKGKQTHGSTPWTGIDPITVAAQIIQGLQMIVARQSDLTKEPAVISVGKITGGVRHNIIPEEAEMIGTIRTLDPEMQDLIHQKIKLTATNIAEASGATAIVDIERGVPVTFNSLELTQAMGPTMKRVAGEDNVVLTRAITGSEDFSFFANKVPGLFLFLGGMPKGKNPMEAAPHHTPDFYIDDSGMKLGVRLLCNLTVDYMNK
ncbi:MAG: amidohydrolase [Haliscomenobacter sp.]|nr:amidohydrolase [Haliscomenobacter sp.]